MIEASEFKRGMCIRYNDEPCLVVEVKFTTPTARGASPIAKARLRQLQTGKLLTESIRVSERFDEVDLSHSPCTYLYSDGTLWHFMDAETFEQFEFRADDIGDLPGYLTEGIEGLRSVSIDGKVVGVELPQTVDLKVVETDPVLKGATAKAQMKPATLETGLKIQVPPYLDAGEMIRVDTRDGHFVERVKG